MDVITVPSPDCTSASRGELGGPQPRAVRAHGGALAEHAHEAGAVIVEPLVQCAAGMRMYDPVYLTLLREACDRHGVHLIADEIAVGFGRTGTLFACEQAGIRRTSCACPRDSPAATCRCQRCSPPTGVRGLLRRVREAQRLPALAQLHRQPAGLRRRARQPRLFRDEPTCSRTTVRWPRTWAPRAHLADHPHVAEVRQSGMIVAAEFVRDQARACPTPGRSGAAESSTGTRCRAGCCCARSATSCTSCRPYVVTPAEIDLMVEVAREGITLAAPEPRVRRGAAARGAARPLRGSAANHVPRVLRLRVGEELTLFNGTGGGVCRARRRLHREHRAVAVGEERALERESPLSLTLAQGVSRGERMDLVMQKATELGVTRLVPVLTERSVVRLDATRPSASSPTGARSRSPPASRAAATARPGCRAAALTDFLRSDPTRTPNCCWHRARSCGSGLPRPVTAVTVLIGPEGGLTRRNRSARWRPASWACASGRACCAPRPRRSPHSRCCSRSSATCDGTRRSMLKRRRLFIAIVGKSWSD